MAAAPEASLVKVLKDDATIAALVSDRIGPRRVQGEPLPSIRYTRVDSEHGHANDGALNQARLTFQLDCFGTTHKQTLDVARAVRQALDNKAFAPVPDPPAQDSLPPIQGAFLQSEQDQPVEQEEGRDTAIFRRSQDWDIWIVEDTAD